MPYAMLESVTSQSAGAEFTCSIAAVCDYEAVLGTWVTKKKLFSFRRPARTTSFWYVPFPSSTYHFLLVRTTSFWYVLPPSRTYHFLLVRTTSFSYVLLPSRTYHFLVVRTTSSFYRLYVICTVTDLARHCHTNARLP